MIETLDPFTMLRALRNEAISPLVVKNENSTFLSRKVVCYPCATTIPCSCDVRTRLELVRLLGTLWGVTVRRSHSPSTRAATRRFPSTRATTQHSLDRGMLHFFSAFAGHEDSVI